MGLFLLTERGLREGFAGKSVALVDFGFHHSQIII